ncbi:MAG TPA: ABC transporter permease [Phototrophicaceae bacterium]|nr:ABC transporter permease [Phototrophicaceae bacterium]
MTPITATPSRSLAVVQVSEPSQVTSPGQIMLRRFLRHRMAVVGLILLTIILVFVIGGALIFSESYANQLALGEKFKPPSLNHLFGTDSVGRDVFARMIWGGQISLMIGIVSVVISIIVGTLVGLISGYVGGWVGSLLMRLTDALLSIPTLVLLLLFSRSLVGNTSTLVILGREFSASVIAIVLIIGLLNWMRLAHIVRAQVLTLKEQEFTTAAIAVGARQTRIIFQHVLPNCLAPIIVNATLGIGSAIVTEAYLSFLGFGVLQPTATWGNILTGAQARLAEVPWVWFFPGIFIILTVLAINFIGDGLRDAFDPRSHH